MIEIICNEDDKNKSKNVNTDKSTVIRRPKNIKQIGDVSSDKKIYIEDYAFSYINSVAYSSQEDEQAGVLLGECQKSDDEKCLFIKGVIKAKNVDKQDKGICFNESVWSGIYSDIEKYFPDLQVVGWFASIPGVTTERMNFLKKIHLGNFAGNMKTMYLLDTQEKEENFYLYENGDLRKQKGYVCFYERNFEMQEYMLEKRGHNTVEQPGRDKVMKSIRTIIQEKEEEQQQKRNTVFMYSVSSFLVVVVLVVGINLMNSYEKMKSFDSSLNNIVDKISDISDSGNRTGLTVGQDNVQSSNGTESGQASTSSSEIVPVNKLAGNVYPTQAETQASQSETQSSVQGTDGQGQSGVDSQNSQAQAGQDNNSQTAAQVNAQTVQGSANTEAAVDYTTYVVKKGDSVMSICQSYYGTVSKYSDVCEFNNIEDVNKLYVGQEIKLP